MNLNEKIELATTGKELEAAAKAHDIPLPDGWSKMSIDRKKRALRTAAPAAEAPRKTVGNRIKESATKALTAFGKGLARGKKDPTVEDRIAAARANATMPHDPKWKRRPHGIEGKLRYIQFIGARAYTTPDYATASRQVRRAMDRQAGKMPLGMTTAAWHRQKGYGTINVRARKAEAA